MGLLVPSLSNSGLSRLSTLDPSGRTNMRAFSPSMAVTAPSLGLEPRRVLMLLHFTWKVDKATLLARAQQLAFLSFPFLSVCLPLLFSPFSPLFFVGFCRLFIFTLFHYVVTNVSGGLHPKLMGSGFVLASLTNLSLHVVVAECAIASHSLSIVL